MHKSERDACHKWAKHVQMRCELLTWALKGHHAPAKLRRLQEERDILAEEQIRYRNLGQMHHTSAKQLELEKASYERGTSSPKSWLEQAAVGAQASDLGLFTPLQKIERQN